MTLAIPTIVANFYMLMWFILSALAAFALIVLMFTDGTEENNDLGMSTTAYWAAITIPVIIALAST